VRVTESDSLDLRFIHSSKHLAGPSADQDAIGEVLPTDHARRIDQEFGGAGDIGPIGAAAPVQQAVTLDDFRGRVGEQREREPKPFGVRAVNSGRISADRDQADPTAVELGNLLLETP